MLGFIKKDILVIKSSMKNLFLFLIVFGLVALRQEDMFLFIPSFISTMIFMSTFSYDEYNNWNVYALALPHGRKNLIKSKYIANLIILLGIGILSTSIFLVVDYFNGKLNLEETLSLMAGCIFALSIFQAILYPFIFKFGIEKGRIGIFVVIFGLSGLAALVIDKIKLDVPVQLVSLLDHYWVIIFFIIMIFSLFISYKISEYIYKKKEF